MGSAGGQSFRPLTVALRQTVASSFTRLHEPHSQCFVRTDKMVIRPPPLQVSQQVGSPLRRGPGATSQRCYPLTDGQMHSFNTSGIQPSRKTQFGAPRL
ncbi:MAG: hypothetical protein AUI01_09170 [Ktedonobacter sp. 13_2_20CM_2_56_8]|nr:MAG: hypothetical protein AUI01_09170 [Ktedonobacter sp. 13_2_20CM_2_56_8]